MEKWFQPAQIRKVLKFIGKRSALYLVAAALTGILLFIAELAFAYILQVFLVVMHIVPPTSMKLPTWIPQSNMYAFLALVSGVMVLRGFGKWLNVYLSMASAEIQKDFQRSRLIEWAMHSQSASTSDILLMFHEGVERVCYVMTNLQSVIVNLSTSTLIWLYLLKISWPVTLAATSSIFLIGLLARRLDKTVAELSRSVHSEVKQINFRLISNIKNLLLVQIYGTQETEKKEIHDRLEKTLGHHLSYLKISYFKSVAPQVLGMILICGLSIAATRRNWIAPTAMITYFYLFIRFVQNFSEAVGYNATILFNLPWAVRMAKWWADHAHDGLRRPQRPVIAASAPAHFPNGVGWDLRQLTYQYPGANTPILQNLSLRVEPRSVLVITGESGSGKSTLLSLLLGLNEPTAGEIHLMPATERVTFKEQIEALRSQTGYVGSESLLVEGTIRDNLVYGLGREPSAEEIKLALDRAECQFVESLPAGIQHSLTDQGQGLSAGQKQRLSFARALLRNPQILILDEATSNLDLQTEDRIIQMLKKMKGQMTIIAVTHREALLQLADQTLHLPQATTPAPQASV